MNKIITAFIKGTEYNPMLKWSSVEKFQDALLDRSGLPDNDAIVVEAYIDDNIVAVNVTFSEFVEKMKLVFDI